MNDTDQHERKSKERRFQSELFALEGDRGRAEQRQEAIQAEIHQIKQKISHLELDKAAKEQESAALVQELARIDYDIAHLKKQMSAL